MTVSPTASCPTAKSPLPTAPSFASVWWDGAVAARRAQSMLFFPALRAAGGHLDEVTQDSEQQAWGTRVPEPPNVALPPANRSAALRCIRARWNAIQADPRFETLLPTLDAAGFILPHDAGRNPGALADILVPFSASGAASKDQSHNMQMIAWNSAMSTRMSQYWYRAFGEAAQRSFPALRVSNFGLVQWSPEFCVIDQSGSEGCRAGKGSTFGLNNAVQTPSFYTQMVEFQCHPDASNRSDHSRDPASCVANPGIDIGLHHFDGVAFGALPRSGYSMLLLHLQRARTRMLANPAATLRPWLAFKSFSPREWDFLPDSGPTDYYQEEVFHAALVGSDAFYYFNPWEGYVGGTRAVMRDHVLLSAVLNELGSVMGCTARTWVTDVNIHSWTDSFFMNGVHLEQPDNESVVVWRFTPKVPLPAGVASALDMARILPGEQVEVGPVFLGGDGSNGTQPGADIGTACTLVFLHAHILVVAPMEDGSLPAPAGVWVSTADTGGVAVRCQLTSTTRTWPLLKTDDDDSAAAQVIFEAGTRMATGFFPCTRVPSAIRLSHGDSDVVLAFAECRRCVGDQCCPHACCGPDATAGSCPVPVGQPRCSGGCHPSAHSSSSDDDAGNKTSLGAAEIDSVDTTDRYICLRISIDGGITFGVLQPNTTHMRSNNPAALVIGKRVLLFFNDAQKNCSTEIAKGADCGGAWMTDSNNSGSSWSTPWKIFPDRTMALCPHGRFCSVSSIVGAATSAVLMPYGRIVLALYSHYESSVGHPHKIGGVMTSFSVSVIFSDSSGKTWTQGNTTLAFLGEPSLVHLPMVGTDALMLKARCADRGFYSKNAYPSPCDASQTNGSGGYRGVALSTDGGVTFTGAQYPRNLPSPGCQGSTILLVDGTVAYSGDDDRSKRRRMTVKRAVSPVHFPSSFGQGELLTANDSGYSALFDPGDGRIGVLWEGSDPKGRCNGSSCSILLSFVPAKTDDNDTTIRFPTCRAPVQRPVFVATTWESTCECVGGGSQWSHGSCGCNHSKPKPASAYRYGKPAWQQTANFTCWHYPNIEALGHISSRLYRGNCTGVKGPCQGQTDPADYHTPLYSLNFGTWANRTVPCTLDAQPFDGGYGPRGDPFCGGGDPATPGARQLPAGRAFLQSNFLSRPVSDYVTHNADDDIMPTNLSALGNRSSLVCKNFTPNQHTKFTGIWWEAGLKLLKQQATLFFTKYKAEDGDIDELVGDFEDLGFGMHGFSSDLHPCPASPPNVTAACFACYDAKWRAIQNDPRFLSVLPQLRAFGFVGNESQPDFLVEAMRAYRCRIGEPCASGAQGAEDTNKLAWNSFVEKRVSQAFVAALQAPMNAFYPHARMSMYSFSVHDPAHCFTPDEFGFMACRGGPNTGGAAGAVGLPIQSPVYYVDAYMCAFDCGDIHAFNPGGGYPGACNVNACTRAGGIARALKQFQNVSSFPLSHFNMAKWVVNHARQSILGGLKSGALFIPWISWRHYCVGCTQSDYYQEQLLHMAIMGAPRFYLFSCWDECIYGSRTTRDDYEVMSAVLKELDLVIGCGASERKWIVDPRPQWRDDFMLSATDVGSERRAWRFTPSLAGSTKRTAKGALVNGTVTRLPSDYMYIVPDDGRKTDLVLHPVQFGFNQSVVATDCSLIFPGGSAGSVLADNRTRFGLWIMQSQHDPPPRVLCRGFGEHVWPVTGFLVHVPTPTPSFKTDDSTRSTATAPVEPTCFDPVDATTCLQQLLDQNATAVHVPNHGNRPWIVRPLWIRRSNLVVTFAPGVVILAKAGSFLGTNDALLSLSGAVNVSLLGGASAFDPSRPQLSTDMPTLRMRKGDYAKPPYRRGEWRHGIWIGSRRGGWGDAAKPPFALPDRETSDCRVSGLRIESSGGDGLCE